MFIFFIHILIQCSGIFESHASEIFILKDDFFLADSPSLTRYNKLEPGNSPTVLRKVNVMNNVVTLEAIQIDGTTSNKTFYVAEKYFTEQLQSNSIFEFKVNPEEILKQAQDDCEDKTLKSQDQKKNITNSEVSEMCKILEKESLDPKDYVPCLKSIKNRISEEENNLNRESISKLYGLHPLEQRFMAYILTVYGEARGIMPPKLHMAAVLQVIRNRYKHAKRKYPDINELDIVLQDLQFSMYNKNDPNWRKALNAKPEDIMDAIEVFAKRDQVTVDVEDKPLTVDSVYHYATDSLIRSSYRPSWAHYKKEVNLTVDGVTLNKKKAHRFFTDIRWQFNPNNQHKRAFQDQGILR